ncbi:MAG: phytanoyl-CoA dioxygenase family protein, partial [Planctomycetes bacterium]|nr:phytanoyl-CoA dioxygenase family protein [Planctomycetota bacterium]
MSAHAHIPAAADPAAAETPALRFVQEPVHPNDEGNILLTLRERGFATISNVFERDSVDGFLAQVTASVTAKETWWHPYEVPEDCALTIHPTRAPRLRQMLRRAFSPIAPGPHVGLVSSGWIVRPHSPDPKVVHDWHKDGDHLVLGCRDGHYDYPSVIHAVMYFTDMTPAHGPTYVIPRSHRDPKLSPHAGTPDEAFLPQKGDVVLWDQRTWHRGSARTVPGLRMMAIHCFYPLPTAINSVPTMSPAQRQALAAATDPIDQLMYGGTWG